MFKRCFFVLQKAPFRLAKWPISGAEMAHIAPWYGLNRTVKWAISESETNFSGLCYGVYQNEVLSEMSFILYCLTFIYISFAKIFCQNKVKKNCKFVSQLFFRSAAVGREKTRGKHLYDGPELCAGLAVIVCRLRKCGVIIIITRVDHCCTMNLSLL